MSRIYSSTEAAELTGRAQVTVTTIAKKSHESADPANRIGQKVGPTWVFTDADLERIRAIDPRGGRPRQDGQPPKYTKPVDEVTKGRPPKEEE